MTDENMKQRIAYLIEHGGVADDPLASCRRLVWVAVGAALVSVIADLITLLR